MIYTDLPLPQATRTNPLVKLDVGQAYVEECNEAQLKRVRNRMQNRATSAAKKTGGKFTTRVITEPVNEITPPAVGAWRTE
jgi:hypothetical protein